MSRRSIFQWANEGRPVERDGKPFSTVRPHNEIWGEMWIRNASLMCDQTRWIDVVTKGGLLP